MLSKQAVAGALSYSIPVGEDLYPAFGCPNCVMEPFHYVDLNVVAFEDGTSVFVDSPGAGTVSFTLNKGEHWSSLGFLDGLCKLVTPENNWTFLQPLMISLEHCAKCQSCGDSCHIFQESGDNPLYRPTFRSEIDRALDARIVSVGRVRPDQSPFRVRYEPGHPSADTNGNVKYPNVNSLIEMTDMREAQRSYEANLDVIGATRRMLQRTIDILKS